MARGRFILSTLGGSRKFAALENDTHRLVYVMLIPNADPLGRIDADPVMLTGLVLTRLNISATQCNTALHDAARCGLVRLYEVDGNQYAEIVDFHKHNDINAAREPQAIIPDCRGVKPPEKPARGTSASEANPLVWYADYIAEGIAAYEELQRSSQPKPDTVQHNAAHVQHNASTVSLEVEVEDEVEDEVEVERELNTHVVSEKSENDARAHSTKKLINQLIETWNEHSHPLPKVEAITPTRITGLKRLIRIAQENNTDPIKLLTAATIVVARDEFWQQRRYSLDNLLGGDKYVRYAEQGAHTAKNNPAQFLTREEQALKILTERENPNA